MKENVKLTKFSSGAGWACKLSPEDLSQVLGNLNNNKTSDTIIDFIPEQKQIDQGAPPDHEDEYEKDEIEVLNDTMDEMAI